MNSQKMEEVTRDHHPLRLLELNGHEMDPHTEVVESYIVFYYQSIYYI